MNGSFYGDFNQEFKPRIEMEQSYIENILRLNKGKQATIYTSFNTANEILNNKFDGVIEEAGRDHVILRDLNKNEWYMILMIYVDYVKFYEKINYKK